MDGDTIRRERPEKTIGPETFTPPEPVVRQYNIDRTTHNPPAGINTVSQEELAGIAGLEAKIEEMEAEVSARKAAIVDRLRSGKAVLEPGTFTASVKTNFKQKRVDWKGAFLDYNGEAEVAKLESAAKGGEREVSSYSLEMKRVDGGK